MMLLNQTNTKLLISSLLIVFFNFSQEKIKVDGISSVKDFIILDSDIDKVLLTWSLKVFQLEVFQDVNS